MKRGDIYSVSLDPKTDHEQQGTCPVLIVSSFAFNHLTGTPIVVPITTGDNFARTAGFTVSLMGVGTETSGHLSTSAKFLAKNRVYFTEH